MKTIHRQAATCVQIQAVGNTAHAVAFSQDIADLQRHSKPQWSFIVHPNHPFRIGKQYSIEVRDPDLAEEQEGKQQ